MSALWTFFIQVLKILYESIWISLVLAFLYSALRLYVDGDAPQGRGWQNLFITWGGHFKASAEFRHRFLFYIYTAMLLYQMLLGRTIWRRPLQIVFRGWRLITSRGINVQVLENFFIFMPFILLLYWTHGDRILKGDSAKIYLFTALKIVTCLSVTIEVLQAILHLGTFQFSDIFYNVLGGAVGGLVYWSGSRARTKKINLRSKGKEEAEDNR